jgi:hypothetical protein
MIDIVRVTRDLDAEMVERPTVRAAFRWRLAG